MTKAKKGHCPFCLKEFSSYDVASVCHSLLRHNHSVDVAKKTGLTKQTVNNYARAFQYLTTSELKKWKDGAISAVMAIKIVAKREKPTASEARKERFARLGRRLIDKPLEKKGG